MRDTIRTARRWPSHRLASVSPSGRRGQSPTTDTLDVDSWRLVHQCPRRRRNLASPSGWKPGNKCWHSIGDTGPAHAKPDFNWLSGPRNGTWKRTCGVSCLRSLAPMCRFAMQHHPGNIHLFATPRYSASPCYVLNSSAQCKCPMAE